ncbi:hypothetical protein BpHYR1_021732 [Brachionus plicatilis]|uniref:Uncharacterized protein n=1 Tax=Brachionus plicatilis TaxID=10195 RepID=A0A3M7PXH1_BRAPC|nr:hypothetical protein BpHYR1_021732 [Brachionus plicatilis]
MIEQNQMITFIFIIGGFVLKKIETFLTKLEIKVTVDLLLNYIGVSNLHLGDAPKNQEKRNLL